MTSVRPKPDHPTPDPSTRLGGPAEPGGRATLVPVELADPAISVAPVTSHRRRAIGMSVYAVLFMISLRFWGLPTDPAFAFIWLWGATIAWRSELPWRDHLRFARDWVPIVLLLTLYNLSRGLANTAHPHVTELVDADRWLTGWATGGGIPTIWLQNRFYDPGQVHWYDVIASFVYFSHFVTALTAAAILWLRNRALWAAFMRRWFFLSAAGLLTYFLYPAAPPWWAAIHNSADQEVAPGAGVIGAVDRISTRGWQLLGLHGTGNMLNRAQNVAANPVAAMPSLHTAFALFVAVFFVSQVARKWWPLLLSYPLAMAITLIYTGEHYLIDVLAGWAYAFVTFLVVGLGERWWRRRSARRRPSTDPAGNPGVVGQQGR
jgi:membrane-associated phospholipid phosphatase